MPSIPGKGFNLAAILLFGRDDVIRSCASGYMTDALLRKENIDRYDDRLLVGTNLIEAYDKLYTENWNRSNRHGHIDPDNFTPEAKNPLLAWFFVNIGRADWMGSGIRNLYKYSKIYTGSEPELIEGDVFKTIVPLKANVKNKKSVRTDLRTGTTQVSAQDERVSLLLEYCATPRTRDEIQQHYGISTREYFRKKILKPLLESGRLKMTIPDKPNSHNQKYVKG